MNAAECQRLRKITGLTQEQFAALLGVSRVTVARWEAKMRAITEPMARLITRVVAEHAAARQKGGKRAKRT